MANEFYLVDCIHYYSTKVFHRTIPCKCENITINFLIRSKKKGYN